MKIALFAGSFDLFTKGHEGVVHTGSQMFDKLFVVIAFNPQKQGMFTVEQRKKQILHFTKDYSNVDVIVCTDQYVASLAKKYGAGYLLRGLRDGKDFEYESNNDKIHQMINPNIQTVYIECPQHLKVISSSMVKSLVGFQGWQKLVKEMVNEQALSDLLRKNSELEITKYWQKLAGEDAVSKKWLEVILTKHSESHRHYHNLSHLVDLLKKADELFKEVEFDSIHRAIISYSIFFHDIIYNPQSRDNESGSAKLFMEYATEKKLMQVLFEGVYETILASASHSSPVKYPVTAYFLDLDLSILGAEEDQFNLYEDQIREEFAFVPDDIFNTERTKIMHKLANPYKTEYGRNKFSHGANRNLKKYEC